VVVTGAAGQIGYALLPLIANGDMLGPNQPVILQLLEIEPVMQVLEGVCMELQDAAYPLLHGIVQTSNPDVAFKDADICLLVGAIPRKEGMKRADLLEKNIGIFKVQGTAIDKYASRNVKVLVVGNPANTNCFTCRHYAPSIPSKNFSALTRLDHNRASGEIANRIGVNVGDVKNIIIWGNHSDTQFPDVSHGHVKNGPSLITAVGNEDYLNNEYITFVQKRGGNVIAKRGFSSALSAAKAIVDHVRDWVLGTPQGEWVSMGVVSDGSYGIEEGLIYSFPVECRNGEYHIVKNLEIGDFARSKMNLTMNELQGEKEIALSLLNR